MEWFGKNALSVLSVLTILFFQSSSADDPELEPGTNYTGTLSFYDGNTLLSTPQDIENNNLHDGFGNTGIDMEANTDGLVFDITFSTNWSISYIYVAYTRQGTTVDPQDYYINYYDPLTGSTELLDFTNFLVEQSVVGSPATFQVSCSVEIFTNSLDLGIVLVDAIDDSRVVEFDIRGVIPTVAPTEAPSDPPTTYAPTPPSVSPTKQPTNMPSVDPTLAPTGAPTIEGYYTITPRDDEYSSQSNFTWSDNVYRLSDRNGTTYSTFRVPGNEPFCATCILAWADIDATLEVTGCGEQPYDFGIVTSDNVIVEPGEFYYCNGTWELVTSGSLVAWQQTYGRLEIWEVDDFGRKYLQESFEFQWDTSTCMWNGETCDTLPLTGGAENSAMFRWTMPKLERDNRANPLIVVWYDLLQVPYSLRPHVYDDWWNLVFTPITEGADLGLEEVVERFQIAFWAAGALMFGFVVVMMVACAFADEAILKEDYMLDTRDIRTTYIHSVTTLIAPQSELKSRSKFTMSRHGLWLFVVLAARLVYMFIFTFIFFYIVFRTINQQSFHILEKNYERFANERDSQLTNMSQAIEGYYYNETDRMEVEVESRNFWCYSVYLNETARLYEEGAIAQYNNHTTQMENSLSGINLNNITAGMYISGNTACSIDADDGAEILSRDPYLKAVYDESGNFVNNTRLNAFLYNRSVLTGPYNFTFIEDYFTAVCEVTSECVGWTFIDTYYDNETDTQVPNEYYFLSELGDPINSELNGICYATAEFDSSLYDFSSINALANYSNYLESLYLSNYENDVDDMFGTLTGIYDSIKEMFVSDEDEDDHKFNVIVNTDATEFSIELDNLNTFGDFDSNTSSLQIFTRWKVTVNCPGCPEGNFSNLYLEQLTDFLFSYNYSNISDFIDDAAGNANLSDFVSIETAVLDFPDVPEIELPFDFNIDDPGIWGLIESIALTLDAILLIYRWYKTAGIVAGIVRGKDVEIRLKYLKTEVADPVPCCTGRGVLDKCLNCILWSYDKMRHCGYNVWRFMYWIWSMLLLTIVVLVILMAYIMVDAILTVDFVTSLGTFDLLTIGIAAQRSIRNEVICTTALTYNNYTLELLQDSRENYAELKNEDALEQNIDELERVDDYNAYFCSAYTSYQASARIVTRDCGCLLTVSTNLTGYEDTIELAFDEDEDTYFSIGVNDSIVEGGGGHDLFIEVELPPIQMTDTRQCYWSIAQIEFDWRWDEDGPGGSNTLTSVEFEVYTRYNDSKPWELQDLESYIYQTPSVDTDNAVQADNVQWDDTVRYVLIKFKDVQLWAGTLSLNEIAFYGEAEEECIGCNTVQFYYWDWSAYDTYILLCPSVTPVHGLMYRGWVRSWLNSQLREGHKPFIKAIRNIALSPFAILLVGSILLILIYLVAFIVEWILIKVNLYRENPYAKVPLVHAKNSEFYNPSMHDVDNAEKHKDVTTYYGNSGTVVDDDKETGDGGAQTGKTDDYNYHGSNIEMGIENEAHGLSKTLRNKSNRPPPPRPPAGLPRTNQGDYLPHQDSTGGLPVVASDARDSQRREIDRIMADGSGVNFTQQWHE